MKFGVSFQVKISFSSNKTKPNDPIHLLLYIHTCARSTGISTVKPNVFTYIKEYYFRIEFDLDT